MLKLLEIKLELRIKLLIYGEIRAELRLSTMLGFAHVFPKQKNTLLGKRADLTFVVGTTSMDQPDIITLGQT